MRKHDPQLQEDGFHWLVPHVAEYVPELMRDFRAEADHGLRCWLLDLIGRAKDARALPLLEEQLSSPDDALRSWAMLGLQQLNTHDSRKALFDAGLGSRKR
ncbi:MAG: HEAT repeat domain-containing protein [Polyangiaceae bacterium]|nr:HEAT repeat domain-containing protein [Polyangiaceae bacterium]